MQGTFLERLNRFAARVELVGRGGCRVFVPNSGRLGELLVPGARVILIPREGPGRLTAFDLSMVYHGKTLVSVDARLPSRLVEVAVEAGLLPELAGYRELRREVRWGKSRLDFQLEGPGGACLVEVKSVTLVRDGRACFPDAPTSRGTRHLEELAVARRKGCRAVVLFVVQRPDAGAFSPNDSTDPAFGRALREAVAAGVEAYAYTCRVTPRRVTLGRRIPVEL